MIQAEVCGSCVGVRGHLSYSGHQDSATCTFTHWIFSSALHKGLLLSAVLLEWLACKSQGSSFSLCLSGTRMKGMHHYTWLLCGCWESKPRPSRLYSKHFADQSISSAPITFSFNDAGDWTNGLECARQALWYDLRGPTAAPSLFISAQ